MAAIYLRHGEHGEKVACGEQEAQMDRANGWVDFDPTPPAVPSFLRPSTPLPDDFPGRDWLAGAGFITMEGIAGKTIEELQEIRGIGASTAKRILDAQ